MILVPVVIIVVITVVAGLAAIGHDDCRYAVDPVCPRPRSIQETFAEFDDEQFAPANVSFVAAGR